MQGMKDYESLTAPLELKIIILEIHWIFEIYLLGNSQIASLKLYENF